MELDQLNLSIKDTSIFILTGAGISAESGIPTFRGKDGIWKSHNAQDLATPEAFYRNPQLVWEWYSYRREVLREKFFNDGHCAIVELEKINPRDFLLATQNVDGLHKAAGSQLISELHGNIWFVRCTQCEAVYEDKSNISGLPRCRECSALLRPHIVWFGESLDPKDLDACHHHASTCDLCLIVGTSAVVQPAASFAMIAGSHGALTVEINPEPTPLSEMVDISLRESASTGLAELLEKLRI